MSRPQTFIRGEKTILECIFYNQDAVAVINQQCECTEEQQNIGIEQKNKQTC